MTPPTLTTRRLTLRPVTLADAPAMKRGLNNWDVVQWLTGPPFPYALSDAEYFVKEIIPQTTSWAIDAGEGFIGIIGVKPDLGYWLDYEYHGQRIMSEAAEAVTAWHFGQSDEALISGHYPGNEASRAVLLKQGFVDAGFEDQLQTATQETVSVQRMELSKVDWMAKHG
ncbi:GNAT family N-acetyltransferase [bacterium]|nr:GNAT family N-acetyltransferase [bacterium]